MLCLLSSRKIVIKIGKKKKRKPESSEEESDDDPPPRHTSKEDDSVRFKITLKKERDSLSMPYCKHSGTIPTTGLDVF